ncbi:hypothetical protein L226DRAFT_565756 [Lentinus tigrinus ALCF2SS1-7]|uniref:Uncharacterized protein n=1 Tax=Lentinus tigrinus ALCF2SS1-6 TaxID=1328759 RepID=A0A5C2SUK6_9APHY|nr:hypothetical protein L227DRAFT_10701 [Lentinus tigrinus ALCF2SS1-6]RPD80934.1 hypothetical protein L226DRAFT_565756 [Lentinus tigrinus ALCF2SS1-7]
MNSYYAPSVASNCKDPPSYREACTPPGSSSTTRNAAPASSFNIREDLPLLSKRVSKRRRNLRRLCVVLGSVLLVIFILQNLSLLSCPLDNVSASVKRAKHREWKTEIKAHGIRVDEWARERQLHEQEVHQWEDERAEWQEERRKWEEERRNEERHRKEVERMRQGVYWTPPIGDPHCSTYRTRVYRAILKDIPSDLNWLEVCNDMPITIQGRPVDRPNGCERNDRGEVQAWWLVNWSEPSCVPYWDTIHYKECTPGKPGFGRYQARLWGINHGDDWENMCKTTPAQIGGRDFGHPTTCDNRGGLHGMVGIWDVPQRGC